MFSPGSRTTFKGTVKPALGGVTVLLEKQVGGKYVTVNKTKADRKGNYSFKVTVGKAGANYRTEIKAVRNGFDGAKSGVHTLHVKG